MSAATIKTMMSSSSQTHTNAHKFKTHTLSPHTHTQTFLTHKLSPNTLTHTLSHTHTHTSTSRSSSVSMRQKELSDRSSLRSSWLSWGGSTRPLKNRTVSGLGLGHDKMPCLSTQHRTCIHTHTGHYTQNMQSTYTQHTECYTYTHSTCTRDVTHTFIQAPSLSHTHTHTHVQALSHTYTNP